MHIVILGLGNPLFQDEGVGVHAIAHLMQNPFSEQVELVDGGTDGMKLLPVIQRADRLLILDAIRYEGARPGELILLRNEEIPVGLYHKLSQHQFGFQEALALSKIMGWQPEEMFLAGIVPQNVNWGVELSPAVEAALPSLYEAVRHQVNSWEAVCA